MDIVEFAHQILELEDSRNFWRSEAEHYKQLYETWFESANKSSDNTMNILGTILTATLDENSNLNKMYRAMDRDPLKGEQS